MNEPNYLELTTEEEEYIEAMQEFFDIDYGTAVERYLAGNLNGEDLSEEDLEFINSLPIESRNLIMPKN